MSQITYYVPAGVTSINLSDGSRAVVVGGQITVNSKFRNELESAGCSANADTDNAVRFSKTVTGVIEKETAAGSEILRVPKKKQWLAKMPFGRIKSVAAGADHTTRIETVLESHTDWIQIGVLNGLAVDLTGVKCCVAPATTLGADNTSATVTPTGGTWVNATIGGAASGSILAGTDLNAAKVTWFDPMNISTLDRVDGGTLPVIMVSVEIPAANANRPAYNYTTTSGWEGEAATANRPYRCRVQAGLFATVAAATGFTATAFTGDCLPIVIRYIPRNADGLCVMVTGDSVHEGAGAVPVNRGFVHIAKDAVSSMSRPIEICNMAISGATSNQYAQRTDAVINAIEPDVLIAAGQTPNNVTAPNIAAANVWAANRDVGRMRAAAHTVGALSMVTTGAPWLAVAPDPVGLSKDFNAAAMVVWNDFRAKLAAAGMGVIDTETLLIGSFDADGQPIFMTGATADGLHLSNAGQALASSPMIAALKQMIF